MEALAKEIIRIIELPLEHKIEVVNRYINAMGLKTPLFHTTNVIGHIGKETYINEVYRIICKPHSLKRNLK